MTAHEYEHIIKELCGHIGITNADDVVSSQHIDYDGHLVGLAVDPDEAAHALLLMLEIGPTVPDRDLGLYHRMLMMNMSNQLPGCFCIHPESHSAVYRLRADMRVNDGATLAALLGSQLEIARNTFEQLAVPT